MSAATAQLPDVASGNHGTAAPMGAFAGAAVGTDRQPLDVPMQGVHGSVGGWSLMGHGFVTMNAVWDPEPRGSSNGFSTSMLMGHARRRLGPGWLELQSMLSADPAMGPAGYPLLLQTGETADGVTPLVDRQHPHDLVAALSASYRTEIEPDVWTFLYVAPVGSPALGPVPFMHRVSGSSNPIAPISHHFLDATHVSHGVVTLGIFNDLLQLEGSWFNGHEPDQHRWQPDEIRLNSYSARLTLTPGRSWAIQASFGDLDEPEQLHPVIDILRTTISATYVSRFTRGIWATTLAWGRNARRETTMTVAEARARLSAPILAHYLGAAAIPPDAEDDFLLVFEARKQSAFFLESSASVGGTTAFGRFERTVKDELFPATDLRHSTLFPVSKLALGVVHDIDVGSAVRFGLGMHVGLHFLPDDLDSAYGPTPRSWGLFVRAGF